MLFGLITACWRATNFRSFNHQITCYITLYRTGKRISSCSTSTPQKLHDHAIDFSDIAHASISWYLVD
jgi:hypothetical protein